MMRCDEVRDADDEREDPRAAGTRERMDAVTKAGFFTAEMFEQLGFTGQPGYIGMGTFKGTGRAPGYHSR